MVWVVSAGAVAAGWIQPGLTAKERESALLLESAAVSKAKAEIGRVALLKPGPGRSLPAREVIARVARVPAEEGKQRRVVEIVRYQYRTGLTILTRVDLDSGATLELRALPNFPAPLAQEELTAAIAIAREADPEVAKFLVARKESGTPPIRHQVLVITNDQLAEFGHRVVLLMIPAAGGGFLRRAIDLTEGRPIKDFGGIR